MLDKIFIEHYSIVSVHLLYIHFVRGFVMARIRRTFAQTDEMIMEKALELFAQKGFRATSTREIASHAGITEVTLYRHFASKEKLFEEIGKKFSPIAVLENIPHDIEEKKIGEKLSYLLRHFFEIFKQRNPLIRVMLAESIAHPEIAKMLFEKIPFRVINLMADIFKMEMQQGNISSLLKPRLLARIFIGQFMAYNIMQEILHGNEFEKFDINDVIETIVSVFLNGIIQKK